MLHLRASEPLCQLGFVANLDNLSVSPFQQQLQNQRVPACEATESVSK